jgi:hypothetical protein
MCEKPRNFVRNRRKTESEQNFVLMTQKLGEIVLNQKVSEFCLNHCEQKETKINHL